MCLCQCFRLSENPPTLSSSSNQSQSHQLRKRHFQEVATRHYSMADVAAAERKKPRWTSATQNKFLFRDLRQERGFHTEKNRDGGLRFDSLSFVFPPPGVPCLFPPPAATRDNNSSSSNMSSSNAGPRYPPPPLSPPPTASSSSGRSPLPSSAP